MAQLLAGLAGHVGPRASAAETFDEADADTGRGRHRMRVGEHDGWAYAVEHVTARRSLPEVLCRLSAGGGEALSLTYTQTVSSFLYAADGQLVSGFDLVATNIRWGHDPHRFDAAMAAAGFLGPGRRKPAASTGARFLQLAFGITLDRELLERPLPSFELLPQPGLV